MGDSMSGMPDMHGMMGTRTASDGQAPATIPDATELTVEAGDLWFQPDVVEVTAGGSANLTVINRDRIFHDLVIDDLEFRLVLTVRCSGLTHPVVRRISRAIVVGGLVDRRRVG